MTRRGPASARENRAGTEDAAAAKRNVTSQGSCTSDGSGEDRREARGRELAALVRQVTEGDGQPIDRLRAAAVGGRELIAGGGQRVAVIASLTLAAEAAGLPRRVAEAVIGRTLRGAL